MGGGTRTMDANFPIFFVFFPIVEMGEMVYLV